MNAGRAPMIQYDPAAAFVPGAVSPADLAVLADSLDAARREILEVDGPLFEKYTLSPQSTPLPTQKVPLDAGFLELPARLLREYRQDRTGSQVGRILATAARLREANDRVVVLGIGGSYMGARALMDACCHPYHNELSRRQRGSRPRMYFEGNNVDNDAAQGLSDLLNDPEHAGQPPRWALIVISKSGGTLETAVAFRIFLAALRKGCAPTELADRIVPITGDAGKLFELAHAVGCREQFPVPDGVGGRFSIFSAVGLLPAAVLGLDIIALLEGAVTMNEHFATSSVAQNLVLNYVGVAHLWEKRGRNIRVLTAWAKSLEGIGLWYDQLLSESLGKEGRGATPLTVVNTRDLHSRAQQHQEGAPDKLITNLILQQWRRDPLTVGMSDWNQDGLNEIGHCTVPELMSAAIAGTNQSYSEAARPTADLRLPANDERSIGQLLQMLMLATVVEGRMLGINPYGQPGVEGYKKHMKHHLGIA